jgi:hypothetical protein
MKKLISLTLFTALGSTLAACEIDVPDLNNPSIDDLETNPTTASVSAATTGLLIGNRRLTAAANGYVAQLGILGREAYNFDQADPRFIGELLEGNLQQGSPFGGNFWGGPYANIRLANTIQRVVGQVPEFSGEEQSAIQGFSKTIEALDLLEVANTRDTNGGVIDTDKRLGEPLGAIVDKPALMAEIARLLDEGADELAAGGDAFPFALSSGYDGFDDPMTFRTFNRAIRARVAVYLEDYAGALTALGMSFLDDGAMASFSDGVYHSYSTGSGDAVNSLINPNIYAHPSLKPGPTGSEANDARYAAKVMMVAPEDAGGAGGLSSDIVFTHYSSPSSPVPIIRNEELILLKAEALYFGTPSDPAGALIALNKVREESGGLAPLVGADIAAPADFVAALLYERRFSLLFEGGHRWIDLRRFEQPIPLDMPDHTQNVRYPIPLAECNARPGEPKCMLGST